MQILNQALSARRQGECGINAHDVRHLTICLACGEIGDGRRMVPMPDGKYHDACLVARLTHDQILRLPAAARDKITIGAAGVELMHKLMDAHSDALNRPRPHR